MTFGVPRFAKLTIPIPPASFLFTYEEAHQQPSKSVFLLVFDSKMLTYTKPGSAAAVSHQGQHDESIIVP